ncbi:hypothetical protein BDN70DRAFT_315060 [Pholiota conissans]|uniref:Uncharacterized protein n=1 Tax=Pholiota conissans TaxID=109636 RepID=A0A9P6D577_9AGAR|nr:hypothetical protein BDN70DRAFT_315060 [Pholiota conissans]
MATLYPQSLPLNTYEPPIYEAYEQCLMMEANAGTDTDTLMLARCLGYLIRELPNEARELLAQEIVECFANFDEMKSLSWLYVNHLIRLFRQSKCRTPAPSEHSSRLSFEMHHSFFNEAVEPQSLCIAS